MTSQPGQQTIATPQYLKNSDNEIWSVNGI